MRGSVKRGAGLELKKGLGMTKIIDGCGILAHLAEAIARARVVRA
jgi:hypothetical protein